MRLTIARKLLLGFGSLLAIFLITGLVVNSNFRTIGKDLKEITEVEEPTSAAAYEMEINVIGTGLGLSICQGIARRTEVRYTSRTLQEGARPSSSDWAWMRHDGGESVGLVTNHGTNHGSIFKHHAYFF